MALVLDPFGVPRGTVPAKASKQAAPNKTTAAKQTVLKQTTPTKTVVTPDPYAAALAAQPSLATLLAQASTQANTLAQQQVNAQVKAIQDQQDQAHATAAAQSAEILKAATAAAQFLTPLGDQAAGDYTAAVQNLGGMVGGYTGGLRDTAQAAQDAAQAQLAGISGNTQTVEGQGANLANLLYGVSGSIPANALATQGLGATALARAIPQQTLSYGQQQAIGQIGAGNTAADALNTQLASARAQLPTLTQQYLKQFQDSAQNVADAAHQKLMDANTIRNTTSEIAARTATGKRLDKAAAAKAKPHIDVSQSKLTGILSDQNGKPITKNVGGKQFLQTLPGFHFDNKGQVVADPKPMTIDQQMARAAEWTRVNHYQSQWNGDPVGGKITPTGGWVVSPDGQSAVPPTKPTKAFAPKPINVGGDMGFVGQDGQLHTFKQADGVSTIPWPTTGTPKIFNAGGYWATIGADGKPHLLTDENKQPLVAGTPKAPATGHYGSRFADATTGHWFVVNSLTGETKDTGQTAPATATHYSGRYAAADGYYHVYNTTTGADMSLGVKVPAKVAAAGSWTKIVDPKTGKVTFYNPTTKETQNTPFTEAVPGQAVGTYSSIKGTDGKLWRINSVTNKTVKTNIPWPTSGSGSALTTDQASKFTGRIENLLIAASTGKKLDGTAVPIVKTRAGAKAELQNAGLWVPGLRPLAMAILNSYYPATGAGGKNWIRVANPALSGG